MSVSGGGSDDDETVEYRAVYDFEASNDDELGFRIGDVIMVRINQEHEPGWLGEYQNHFQHSVLLRKVLEFFGLKLF